MSDISVEKINESLAERFISNNVEMSEAYLIHDPSDIRKPYSKKIENIGKVRDLKGNIINGYSSHNIVGIADNNKSVHLLSHISYSNKDSKFLKRELIKKLENNKEFEGEEKARALYKSEEYFNKKIVSNKEIQDISIKLKSLKANLKITHILDREFDDDEYLKVIDSGINDNFIVRSKKTRLDESTNKDEKSTKLITSKFEQNYIIDVQKIQFKDKVYQDVKIEILWKKYYGYSAIRITIRDRKGDEIFKNPMLLLTNKPVNCNEDAYQIYLGYLKRSRIEYVFKFLKEGLGWENIQTRNFQGIQKLLSICFYVSSYLYEIGEEAAHDDYAILLAEIGGGKGKVTRYYILEGVKLMLGKTRIEAVFEKRHITTKTQESIKNTLSV
tara:strand:- start:36 stop:1193 length:1158 start_codon:yes stop_codon:yes gene_type:complete